MGVVEINQLKTFSLIEARKLLPLINHITKVSRKQVQQLMEQLEIQSTYGGKINSTLEDQINLKVEIWQNKLQKLGVRAQGLWIADFDSGDGYFCWKYPEETIEFWHGYGEGFIGRVPISEWEKRQVLVPFDHVKSRPIIFNL